MYSVIIPVLNGERYIEECLNSLLEQTLPAHQIIVVDDYSHDSTAQIVRRFTRLNSQIIYLKHEKRLGVAAARNSALRVLDPRIKYFGYCDADDFWNPRKAEVQISFLNKHREFFGCSSAAELVDQSSRPTGYRDFGGEQALKDFGIRNFVIFSSLFIRAEYKIIVFDSSYFHEDYFYLYCFYIKSLKLKILNERLVSYRIHSSSKSSNKIKSLYYHIALLVRLEYRVANIFKLLLLNLISRLTE